MKVKGERGRGYCAYCGARLEKGDIFCSVCGKKIIYKNKSRKWLIGVVAAAACLILIIALRYFFAVKDGGGDDTLIYIKNDSFYSINLASGSKTATAYDGRMNHIGRAEISEDGKMICWLSEDDGDGGCLKIQPVGKPEALKIIDEGVSNFKLCGSERVVFCKEGYRGLYVSDFDGNKEKIASNAGFLYWLDEARENILWLQNEGAALGQTLYCRDAALKEEAVKLAENIDSVSYISPDMKLIVAEGKDGLAVIEDFKFKTAISKGAAFAGSGDSSSVFYYITPEENSLYKYDAGDTKKVCGQCTRVLGVYKDAAVYNCIGGDSIEKSYVYLDGVQTELSRTVDTGVFMANEEQNKAFCLLFDEEEAQYPSLYTLDLNSGEMEWISDNAVEICLVSGENVYYTKTADNESYDLYCGDVLLEEDIETGMAWNRPGEDGIWYAKNREDLNGCFTLKWYNGKEIIKAADDVSHVKLYPGGRAVLITDYDIDSGVGDLKLFDGKKELICLDENVSDIVTADILG